MTFTSRDIVELVTDRAAAAYAVSSNPEMRVWQFNGEYSNDLAIDEFANQVSNIEIIDQYSGSIPELFSLDKIRDHGVNIRVDRTLLLDSNVANYTRKFIAGRLVGDFEKSVAALIGWYARREMSVHPGFSLMETISGGMNNVVHGEELVRMALLLSGMDREAFLNRGEIKLEAAGGRRTKSRTRANATTRRLTRRLHERFEERIHNLQRSTRAVVPDNDREIFANRAARVRDKLHKARIDPGRIDTRRIVRRFDDLTLRNV